MQAVVEGVGVPVAIGATGVLLLVLNPLDLGVGAVIVFGLVLGVVWTASPSASTARTRARSATRCAAARSIAGGFDLADEPRRSTRCSGPTTPATCGSVWICSRASLARGGGALRRSPEHRTPRCACARWSTSPRRRPQRSRRGRRARRRLASSPEASRRRAAAAAAAGERGHAPRAPRRRRPVGARRGARRGRRRRTPPSRRSSGASSRPPMRHERRAARPRRFDASATQRCRRSRPRSPAPARRRRLSLVRAAATGAADTASGRRPGAGRSRPLGRARRARRARFGRRAAVAPDVLDDVFATRPRSRRTRSPPASRSANRTVRSSGRSTTRSNSRAGSSSPCSPSATAIASALRSGSSSTATGAPRAGGRGPRRRPLARRGRRRRPARSPRPHAALSAPRRSRVSARAKEWIADIADDPDGVLALLLARPLRTSRSSGLIWSRGAALVARVMSRGRLALADADERGFPDTRSRMKMSRALLVSRRSTRLVASEAKETKRPSALTAASAAFVCLRAAAADALASGLAGCSVVDEDIGVVIRFAGAGRSRRLEADVAAVGADRGFPAKTAVVCMAAGAAYADELGRAGGSVVHEYIRVQPESGRVARTCSCLRGRGSGRRPTRTR